MTTVYLAQKLMSVKLDRTEFMKVKWLQKSTAQEKRTVVESLKRLLKEEQNKNSCRLCLREGSVKIFSADKNIANDIKYVLEIQVEEGDGKPQHVCTDCLLTLEGAVQLKTTAEATQWRLQQEAALLFESETAPEEVSTESARQHGGYFTLKPGRREVVREWLCKKCRRIFHTEAEFADHVELPNCRLTTASDPSRRVVCEYCGQAYRCTGLLNRHRLTHSESPGGYKCRYCPYRSHARYCTRSHERAHTGERPYRCATCHKASTPLHEHARHCTRSHEHAHIGERPYRCAACHKTFTSPANLWTHKKTHQPPKHHCQHCPKSYTHKMLLRDHIATQHSTETPFNCQTCGKAFATRKRLHKHERGVHGRPPLTRRCARAGATDRQP